MSGLNSSNTKISIEKARKKFERLEKDIKTIEKSEDKHFKEMVHDKLIAENTPAVFYPRIILQLCSRKSIENNYDVILSYFYNNCSLSKEFSEKIINDVYRNSPLEKNHFTKDKKIIFHSRWEDNEKEIIHTIKPINNKNGLYCLYFSKNCTYRDIEYYLKHKLQNVVKATTVKNDRTSTKGLLEKCFTGWLTLHGLKSKEIERMFIDIYGYDEVERIPLAATIQRNRNRIKKDDCFSEAEKELDEVLKDENLKKVIQDYEEKLQNLYAGKNTHQQRMELLNKKPRFLDLSFDAEKSLFHVKYVK